MAQLLSMQFGSQSGRTRASVPIAKDDIQTVFAGKEWIFTPGLPEMKQPRADAPNAAPGFRSGDYVVVHIERADECDETFGSTGYWIPVRLVHPTDVAGIFARGA